MVRRWSYIKEQNHHTKTSFASLDFVHQEVSFLTNVHFRKSISHNSKLLRKSWAKRKHLANWLPLQSVLSDWSNDYLFFKKYNRMVLTFNIFRNSFISLNFLLLKKTATLIQQSSESFFFTFPTKRTLAYFTRVNPSTYSFLTSLKNTPLMYISSPTGLSTIKQQAPFLAGGALSWHGDTFSNPQIQHKERAIELLYACFLNISIIKHVEIYKLFNMLILTTLKSN